SPAGALVYYTLDGSDPRVAGTGAISSSAVAYSGPITLNVARRVKARIFSSGSWSALVDQTFVMPTSFPLRIVEMHYHPGSHAGEQVILAGPVGETLQNFIYDDNAPWPAEADGNGPSLEVIDPLGDPGDPVNWRASLVNGGTPGTTASPPIVLSSSFGYMIGH